MATPPDSLTPTGVPRFTSLWTVISKGFNTAPTTRLRTIQAWWACRDLAILRGSRTTPRRSLDELPDPLLRQPYRKNSQTHEQQPTVNIIGIEAQDRSSMRNPAANRISARHSLAARSWADQLRG